MGEEGKKEKKTNESKGVLFLAFPDGDDFSSIYEVRSILILLKYINFIYTLIQWLWYRKLLLFWIIFPFFSLIASLLKFLAVNSALKRKRKTVRERERMFLSLFSGSWDGSPLTFFGEIFPFSRTVLDSQHRCICQERYLFFHTLKPKG